MVISIQRLPWAGDPAVLTHGNADMSQLGEKTAPFPSSLRSIPSSLDLSLLSSLLHSLPTARASTGMEWDCLFPGETGIPCKWEHLFSLGLYQHQHPHHCSCFFPTHLSDFAWEFQPTLGFLSPQQQLSPSLRFAGMLNLTSYCSCIFLLQTPGSVWQEQPALLVPSSNSQLGDEIGRLGLACAGLRAAGSSSLFTALPGSCVSREHQQQDWGFISSPPVKTWPSPEQHFCRAPHPPGKSPAGAFRGGFTSGGDLPRTAWALRGELAACGAGNAPRHCRSPEGCSSRSSSGTTSPAAPAEGGAGSRDRKLPSNEPTR